MGQLLRLVFLLFMFQYVSFKIFVMRIFYAFPEELSETAVTSGKLKNYSTGFSKEKEHAFWNTG